MTNTNTLPLNEPVSRTLPFTLQELAEVATGVTENYLSLKELPPLRDDNQNDIAISASSDSLVEFYFFNNPNTYGAEDDWSTRFALSNNGHLLHLHLVVFTDGVYVGASSRPIERSGAPDLFRHTAKKAAGPQKPLSKKARKRGKTA